MTVLLRVRRLIEAISPDPVCDECIADYLHLGVRQHANHKTRRLAEVHGFFRRKDVCSKCGRTKLVIGTTHQL